ncbi:hypothetical protein KJ877_05495 [bacterium]|nr:hypothetical protein [bacterium]MBU1990486.1 hypothetical protein [bacterium]
MKFDTSTLMMLFFVLFFIISMWKIYAFLPNKALADDDTTKESEDELMRLMLKVIKENKGELDLEQLFAKMTQEESFDAQHFWRFNLNRLKHLLNKHYLKNPHAKNLQDIYTQQI